MSDQLRNVPRMEQRASGLWVPEALAEPPLACAYCGCTEYSGCDLGDGQACTWASRGPQNPVCSNPDCLADAYDDPEPDDDTDEEDDE